MAEPCPIDGPRRISPSQTPWPDPRRLRAPTFFAAVQDYNRSATVNVALRQTQNSSGSVIRRLPTGIIVGVALPVLVTAACARKPADHTPPTESGPQASAERGNHQPKASIIGLMNLTISQEGRPIARLRADGRTEGTEPDRTGKPARFVPGPTLHADGTITLTKAGFGARVQRDGNIYVVSAPSRGSREHLFGRISGNVLKLANSDNSWAVRVEGDTIRFNGPGFPNKIEGTVGDRERHTALVMTAAFLIDMSITRR